jgi:NAD+ synthase (glutamine-hydrolysing)
MTTTDLPFDSIYRHGLARVAVCIPSLKVADTNYNAARTIALARQAAEKHAAVALFPELGLSAYSNEDLFHQDALLAASLAALDEVIKASHHIAPLLVVGAPLVHENKLFN